MAADITGLIFNVQKCSIHDGRGMRTTVFFKGCSMHCLWCANPESIGLRPVLSFNPTNCLGCKACARACQNAATGITADGGLTYSREACVACGSCAEICPMEGRILYGEEVTVDELFHRVYKDRFYYERSGGGVTFSGGEPFLQPEFLREIAKKCHDHGIHVAIETCCFADYENFCSALDYIDFIYADIKHMDGEKHRYITGHDNQKILSNLEKIDRHGIEMVVRTPVVPGYNDSLENIEKTAAFCAGLKNVSKYELLAYHKLGINKYKALGLEYKLPDVETPDEEKMETLRSAADTILRKVGKTCIYNKDNDLE